VKVQQKGTAELHTVCFSCLALTRYSIRGIDRLAAPGPAAALTLIATWAQAVLHQCWFAGMANSLAGS
jgi:hypothetical protein